ncbi:hypothetical protein CIHG_00627 [Coccidioides immitis H538.4]|uniref:Uncharacterized protein n=3 Tax=Coccidioides immitis TaxID=5501 RepID=A0A0J8QKR9_COCIT|nr:hypothetical protein CIRG_07436 [Coccidioides immitis RMSCC 2394]KMU71788.1 hypothetical protein CISG_00098 [Coccidioides immitis RMSCC 3703]KMU82844.1 hypothetical protein CIHG_00627 [Coccidioides immitis H538.4]
MAHYSEIIAPAISFVGLFGWLSSISSHTKLSLAMSRCESDTKYRIVTKPVFDRYSTVWLALDTRLERYVAVKAAPQSRNQTRFCIVPFVCHRLAASRAQSGPLSPGRIRSVMAVMRLLQEDLFQLLDLVLFSFRLRSHKNSPA